MRAADGSPSWREGGNSIRFLPDKAHGGGLELFTKSTHQPQRLAIAGAFFNVEEE